MSVLTQMVAALAWPVSRIKRRGKEEGDPLQSDGETLEPRENGSDVEANAEVLPNGASGPGPVEQTSTVPVSAVAAAAGPAQEPAPAGQPSVPTPGAEPPANVSSKDEDDILKLFTEDMNGNEDMQRLAPFLKDVDVSDLAEECRAVAQALQRQR